MSNFTDFFPAAGAGGGGFTKMNKYSTFRALNDATHKTWVDVFYGLDYTNTSSGSTTISAVQGTSPTNGPSFYPTTNQAVGGTFVHNGTTHTITSNTSGSNFSISFTPALTAAMTYGAAVTITSPTYLTVNPATDLGLEDGASIGYFMIGGGNKASNASYGPFGGNIIQGTAIITTASTNLVLTPGQGLLGPWNGTSTGTNSTITGGLTITTANGTNHTGFPGIKDPSLSPGQGINGYGTGALGYNQAATLGQNTPHHGFGTAVSLLNAEYGSDGAILLFY